MTDTPNGTPTVDALVDEALALGEGLGRPLRYAQLNSFYNGSTGTIMRNLHRSLMDEGVDSYIFWGRRHGTINDHERCCASNAGVYLHGALSRLTDRAGFYSKRDTAKLLRRLDEIDPDVVHLHNVHGYWVNVEMLFGWLVKHRCQVRWTLHDCWALTGHCPYFQYVGCDRWLTGCYNCPQRKGYPSSLFLDSSKRNWEDKRRAFTSVPPERMTLITPSHWLAGLVGQSFLRAYPIEVRRNTVDRSVFKPTPSDFRERYGIGDRFMILGVASPWTERKGLGDFVKLSAKLDERSAVVLVGLAKNQVRAFTRQVDATDDGDSECDSMTGSDIAGLFEGLIAERDSSDISAYTGSNSKADFSNRAFAVAAGDFIPCAEAVDMSGLRAVAVQLARGCLVVMMERTENQRQLAGIYTAADALFNPTREDNFPTVNLEAEACGTRVFTYDVGGCRETVGQESSRVIERTCVSNPVLRAKGVNGR